MISGRSGRPFESRCLVELTKTIGQALRVPFTPWMLTRDRTIAELALKIDALPERNFSRQLLPGNYDKSISARRDGEMFSALCQHPTGSLGSFKKWPLGGGHIPDIPCRLFQ